MKTSSERIEAELERAEAARAAGNEGMARVCARRAAGLAAAAYLEQHPHHDWGTSAMDRLAGMAGEATLPETVRQAAARLMARITPDHTLPFPEDPLADARLIIGQVESLTP